MSNEALKNEILKVEPNEIAKATYWNQSWKIPGTAYSITGFSRAAYRYINFVSQYFIMNTHTTEGRDFTYLS
jgi:hypothetical protein